VPDLTLRLKKRDGYLDFKRRAPQLRCVGNDRDNSAINIAICNTHNQDRGIGSHPEGEQPNFTVDYFQISSKAPLDEQTFDLVAELPEGITSQQFRLMMQNLRAERFPLKMHMQSKEFASYEPIVAKSGTKLKESTAGNGAAPAPRASSDGFPDLPSNRPGMVAQHSVGGGFVLIRLKAQQEPISELARMLRLPDGQPLVDKTGLTGKYDFTLEFSSEVPNAASGGGAQLPVTPNLFTALQEQLGLQLVGKKIPFGVVVVDSVDKVPTEN